MPNDRRAMLKAFAGASLASLGLVNQVQASQTAEAPSMEPLLGTGLDPFAVYRQMFASSASGDECCWWFMGALPLIVDDVGPVDTVQEETLRAHRTENVGEDLTHLHWREVGVFRDIATGLIPEKWFNPITGQAVPRLSSLKGGPAHYTVRRSGKGIAVELTLPNSQVQGITVSATINGDRVCLTHIEDKVRAMAPNPPTTRRTTFKIYASLAELRGGNPSVSARGFYGVREMRTGSIFVNGLMQKARMDEKVNPLAWTRAEMAYPTFFEGNRIATP